MGHWELFFFFLCISLIYSVVGFGGRNSYIALLSLYAIPYKETMLIALLCNILVVASGAFVYFKKHQLDWRRVLPIVLVSVPFSFLGTRYKVGHQNLYLILGTNLVIISSILWYKTKERELYTVAHNRKLSYVVDGLIGGYIGFLSSLLGIGGGVFLAPMLNFRKWDNPKKIATICAIFILANSICGLTMLTNHMPKNINTIRLASLCFAVLIGGQLGARIGANKLSVGTIRKLTALLVFITALEILSRHLPVV